MTQCERILDYMTRFGGITPSEAMDDLGCFRLAARVSDLKSKGYHIKSEMVAKKNRYGENVRIARYSLEEA